MPEATDARGCDAVDRPDAAEDPDACIPRCAAVLCGKADGCGASCVAGSGCCSPRCVGKLCGELDGCGGYCVNAGCYTKPTGEGCTTDAECQTGRCGCEGGADRVCLPVNHDRRCLNWVSCIADADCVSDTCGCNGGFERVCLPQGYTEACGNWTQCTDHAECLTGRCGCSFSETRSCLPSDQYPLDCI